jgi:hypothetical protein
MGEASSTLRLIAPIKDEAGRGKKPVGWTALYLSTIPQQQGGHLAQRITTCQFALVNKAAALSTLPKH